MSDIGQWINDNTLVFGVICAGVFGVLVATAVVVYYKCYAKAGNPNPELPQSTWVNASQFQPVPVQAGSRASARQSRGSVGVTGGNRLSTPRPPPMKTVKLLTDASTPLAEFRLILGMYYAKHAPSMSVEDVELASDSHGDSTAGRRQLSAALQQEYGQDLDNFYEGVQNGTENVPRKPLAQRKELQPSVKYVGAGMQNTAELTRNTSLSSALAARGLERHYDLLRENGIQSVADMAKMSSEVVSMLFPAQDQDAIQSMVTAARLLMGEDDHDDV